MTDAKPFLRHVVATLAYRAAKMLRDAPADFAEMRAGAGCRTAGEIVLHLGDLVEWAATAARGAAKWQPAAAQPWQASVDRFFAALALLDERLASEGPLACPWEGLLQGPLADSLTHVGQLATLRRLAGSPIRGENYRLASIETGRVGPDQASPNLEFD